MRRARLLVCAWLVLLAPEVAVAQRDHTGPLISARYTEPTTRYPHGVLGDKIEHGALELTYQNRAAPVTLRLPVERVFEDTEPRIVDVTGDGQAEVIVVESHRDKGARLAIYTDKGLLAATPYIGRRNRWLAPAAVADLDGDGAVEIAYIDRPHLAKTLRVWRFSGGALTQVAFLEGLTNHRIGERDIAGGLRDCGQGPEIITANADWTRLFATRITNNRLTSRDIGPHAGRASFARALACR